MADDISAQLRHIASHLGDRVNAGVICAAADKIEALHGSRGVLLPPDAVKDTDGVNPWFLIGAVRGRLLHDGTLTPEQWNSIVDLAVRFQQKLERVPA